MTTENTTEITKRLNVLIHYTIDEAFLLDQAIANVNSPNIREALINFRQECEETTKELAELIQKYGGETPSHTRDFKGFFMQGYAAMRGLFSDQGVMKALHTNLNFIVRAFESAIVGGLPEDVNSNVVKMHDQYKTQLEYVASQMQTRFLTKELFLNDCCIQISSWLS